MDENRTLHELFEQNSSTASCLFSDTFVLNCRHRVRLEHASVFLSYEPITGTLLHSARPDLGTCMEYIRSSVARVRCRNKLEQQRSRKIHGLMIWRGGKCQKRN